MKPTRKKTGLIIGGVCAAQAVGVLICSLGGGSVRVGNASAYSNYQASSNRLGLFGNWFDGGISKVNHMDNASPTNFDGEYDADEYVDGENLRAVVANASVSLQTRTYDACTAALKAKLQALEGYADTYNEENYQSGRQAYIVARVPSKKLDAFVDSLAEHAVVLSKNVSFSDVTKDLIDTESKKLALEAERDALLQLMEKTDYVDGIIQVQQRLSVVRSDLESYLKQLQELKNQTEYSTISISLSEVDRISAPSQKFGAQAGSGFLNSIKRIGAGFRNFALWLIAAVPYLALLAVPAIVAAVLLKRAGKKRAAKKAQKRAAREG